MVIPFFHSWEFNILLEAENVSGPAAPEQGRGPTASFRLYLIPEQGKLSTYFGITAQLRASLLCSASGRDTSRAAIHTFQGLWFLTEGDR